MKEQSFQDIINEYKDTITIINEKQNQLKQDLSNTQLTFETLLKPFFDGLFCTVDVTKDHVHVFFSSCRISASQMKEIIKLADQINHAWWIDYDDMNDEPFILTIPFFTNEERNKSVKDKT